MKVLFMKTFMEKHAMLRNGILWFAICLFGGVCTQPIQATEIGSRVKNFQLSDESDKSHSLRSYSGKILVLVFWSYKCPSSNNYTQRMDALQNKFRNNGVNVLGVATGKSETAAGIRANKNSMNVSIPILLDSDGTLAALLNATRTPSVFIVDRKGVLRYQGAFDNDAHSGDQPVKAYTEDALDALIAGRPVAIPETKAEGCIIRR